MSHITSLDQHSIYTDLMKCFVHHGHKVVIVTPSEKRYGKETYCESDDSISVLHVKTGNLQKCGMIEKGISMLSISRKFCKGIRKFYPDTTFDLLLYSTPPITLCNAVKRIKKTYQVKTYLMLKDIFPQNAVDIGLLSKNGIKGCLYSYFSFVEKKLYDLSDHIGCMSNGNVKYVLDNYKNIRSEKLNVCPNSILLETNTITNEQKTSLKDRYGIPNSKKIFIYGGNLGKPQDVPFIVRCIRAANDCSDAFFVVVGSGTDYSIIKDYYDKEKPSNMIVIDQMPRDEYEQITAACDVGLVFLDHRFTIPNFPSRILSYMHAGIPILACTDKNTDLKDVIKEGEFGWWCESTDEKRFVELVKSVCQSDSSQIGRNGRIYLETHFTVEDSYRAITSCL